MAINYPGSVDFFNEPSLPENTALASAGDATRAHVPLLHDHGQAIVALEENAAFKDHDHSGAGDTAHGDKLDQANTHENADTDTAVTSIHHTLGTNAFQAAPGNHVHSYNQLLDRPYIVCTTTTRPSDPFIGMQIYETDTNTVRVWATFPTNPDATGVIGGDEFQRESYTNLDPTLWEQTYLNPFSYGSWCIPVYGEARWVPALTQSNWCIARRISEDDRYTESDDQEIESHWGTHDYDYHHDYGQEAPCNDHYFRMSDDNLSYVRVAIFWKWAVVSYTSNGPDNEVVLGTLFLPDWEPSLIWTIRAIDWGFHIYRNGIHCGSIFDNNHLHNRGAGYRSWGIGTHVVGYSGGQYRPPDIIEVKIKDIVSYTPASRWGLLPVASRPVLIAQARTPQTIPPAAEYAIWLYWTETGIWRGTPAPPPLDEPVSDITITEPGVYHVHASICWDPQATYHDQSMVSIKVNGQDIARKNWEFIRGFSYVPGFPQTNEINFYRRFETGDAVRVVTRHNAAYGRSSRLWVDEQAPSAQASYVELAFFSP